MFVLIYGNYCIGAYKNVINGIPNNNEQIYVVNGQIHTTNPYISCDFVGLWGKFFAVNRHYNVEFAIITTKHSTKLENFADKIIYSTIDYICKCIDLNGYSTLHFPITYDQREQKLYFQNDHILNQIIVLYFPKNCSIIDNYFIIPEYLKSMKLPEKLDLKYDHYVGYNNPSYRVIIFKKLYFRQTVIGELTEEIKETMLCKYEYLLLIDSQFPIESDGCCFKCKDISFYYHTLNFISIAIDDEEDLPDRHMSSINAFMLRNKKECPKVENKSVEIDTGTFLDYLGVIRPTNDKIAINHDVL